MSLRSARPRNIILCVISALRADAVSYTRDRRFFERQGLTPLPETPTLDRLAEQGTWCSRAFSVSPRTLSANASLLTGRFPGEHRVLTGTTTSLPTSMPTLFQALAEAGYHTLAAVDFDRVLLGPGLARGAQEVFIRDERAAVERAARCPGGCFLFIQLGDIHAPYLQSPAGPRASLPTGRETPPSKDETPDPRALYDRLRHRYGLPEPGAGLRASLMAGDHRRVGGVPEVPRWVLDDFAILRVAMRLEGDYFRTIFPLYQQGINAFDRGRFAGLIEHLQDKALLDDTLLIVTSDHGEHAAGDNDFGHGRDLSDGVLRVPLLFSFPGVVHERFRHEAPVSLVDIAPTLLDFARAPALPASVRGLSLHDALTGASELPQDRGVFAERWVVETGPQSRPAQRLLAQRSLRTDRLKLVVQGADLEGDTQVLNLVDPDLNLERFVLAINHRYMGLANTRPLESWIKARSGKGQVPHDILSDVLVLARNTLGRDRYRVQHQRRLRSYLADRLQHYYRAGTVDVPALVRSFYEAYFIATPSDAELQRLVVLVRHHCHTLEDILRLFEQQGPCRERYQLFDLERDSDEEVNLFSVGLSVEQERDALALEVMLMENYLGIPEQGVDQAPSGDSALGLRR